MIASLRGQVAEKTLNGAIIDVQGVGYRVHFSLLTLSRLPAEGSSVQVRIRTVVREDAFDLFGFLTVEEEQLFELLTSVSHVGPKLALMVLSGIEIESLVRAVAHGEVGLLTKIHGVGKKTAERLVLELKDKVKLLSFKKQNSLSALPSGPKADLISALLNLGYKSSEADKAAETAGTALGEEATFEALFREALKSLRGKSA